MTPDSTRHCLAGTAVTRAWRAFEREQLLGQRQLVGIIGYSANARLGEHEQLATEAGQDLVWTKPLPADEVIRAQLSTLLLRRNRNLKLDALEAV